MPAPTLTPGNEKQEEQNNPGQRHADQTFNELARSEQDAVNMDAFEDSYKNDTADDTQENANIKRVKNGEAGSTPTPTWVNNTSEAPKEQRINFWSRVKKASPVLGIGGIVTAFGVIVTVLTTPSLLIVQMKEAMVGKFDTQLTSMTTRSNKLLLTHISDATKGICTNAVSLGCKFSTLNDTEVKNLKEAGFTFKDESRNSLTKRTTITGYVYKGQEISAKNFNSVMTSNSDVRTAFKTAYNPKYAGFVGKAWAAVAAKFKINKQAPELDGNDKEKANKKLQSIATEGMADEGTAGSSIVEGEQKDPNCKSNCATWSAEEVQQANGAVSALAGEGKDGVAASKITNAIDTMNISGVKNTVAITGYADSACTAIGAFNTLTYAAKAVRALQLVRYMMVFSSVADKIKAGDSPKAEDVAYLGTILTTVKKDSKWNTLVGAATDSFGYKYAAYGDSSASKKSMNIANRFMAGGGMVGDLNNFANTIYGFFGDRASARKVAHDTCGVLANPVVQGASLLVGVAALLVPGVNVGLEISKAAISAGVSIGISMIPSLLADIVAGTVTQNISGEEAGDAIASGSGSLLSDSLAGQNGAAPMSKEDAIAYNNAQTDTSNQYIADELKDTSPFDATNSHTFLGSIVASLLPLKSSANPLTTVGSFLTNSFQSLIPTTKALSSEEYAKALDVCQDPDAQDAGYAVDPFCNIIRGIPVKYLNKDPLLVVKQLTDAGDMSEDGTPQGAYADTIKKCMTSDSPLGYSSDTNFNVDEAKGCVINDSNANYFLNYMDQRINLGMSGEDVAGSSGNTGQITDKKALAQKIVAKNKISYLGPVQPVLAKIADGSIDPNAEPCGINLNILQIIDKITDQHSITISDINRHCIDSAIGSGTGSRHYAGNGSAIDISAIDGKATNGRDANALSIINLLLPTLAQIGTAAGSYSGIGQVQCGATPALPAGVRSFEDTCNHLHLDVPPKSDPNLKYDASGW